MSSRTAVLFMTGFLLLPAPASAIGPWEVIAAVHRAERSRLWTDNSGQAQLTIRLASGEDIIRRFRFYRWRRSSGQVRTLTIFSYPPAVKGTAVLRIHQARNCGQAWIRQPALRRVRRLPPAHLSGRLAGDLDPTELGLIWDLGSWSSSKASARLEGRANMDGLRCEIIVVEPHRPVCGYGRIRTWVSIGDWLVRKAELFDVAGALVKTVEYEKIKLIEGYPTDVSVTIRPGYGRGFSRLVIESIHYNRGLDPLIFTVGRLSQAH